MPEAPQLSPQLAQEVQQLARALMTATRSWTLYPPAHPTVGQSVVRLEEVVRRSVSSAVFSIGIAPDTLIIEGALADASQGGIAEAAALLHDHDLLRLTFVGDVPAEALRRLLKILSTDPNEVRRRGGPASIWGAEGHSSIVIEQVDYQKVLAREKTDAPEAARRDDIWHSIVADIGSPRAVFDERAQRRLLEIAGSPVDIGAMATAVMAPKCAPDGSPMITTQAAMVLAAFRHLTNIVGVMAPERLPEVMGNLASAATQLDARVVMQVMQTEEHAGDRLAVVHGMAAAFDDAKVAQLLATSLALDGQASDRLATIFNTIAPDEDRKRRVLSLTRNLLSETDFGRASQFERLWTSMEELLITYNEKPFMSEAYRTSLDGMGGRAERMATLDLPPELPEWVETLGQENVRKLSVALLIDLLTLERDEARATDIAADMEALAEDLLMGGAYDDGATVARALAVRGAANGLVGRDACRRSLDRLGESLAMRETAALVGDVDEPAWSAIRSVVVTIGPSTIEALRPLIAVEQETAGSRRATEVVLGFGVAAVSRLGALVGDPRWFVQRTGAELLGRIAAPEAVSLLQPLLRKSDPRVARAAVIALCNIDDPAAARAVHTVLRAATGTLRDAVIDALVADQDPRVVPMLSRILQESEPMTKDHEVVLGTIAAIGRVGGDGALPAVTAIMRRRGWLGRKKLRALKEASVATLRRIGTPASAAVLADAARTGDRMLRRIAAH